MKFLVIAKNKKINLNTIKFTGQELHLFMLLEWEPLPY
jgi:hypothetical protein